MKIVKISSTALVLGSLSWRGATAGLCTLMVRGGTGSGVSEEADMFSSEEMSEQSAMVLAARRSGPDCGHRPRTNLSCCCDCLSATALWPHSLQGTGEIIAATPPPCDQLMVTRGSNQAAHGDQGCSSVLAAGELVTSRQVAGPRPGCCRVMFGLGRIWRYYGQRPTAASQRFCVPELN